MPSDWENTLDNTLWHELLSLFIGVKKLHIGSSLTLEFSLKPWNQMPGSWSWNSYLSCKNWRYSSRSVKQKTRFLRSSKFGNPWAALCICWLRVCVCRTHTGPTPILIPRRTAPRTPIPALTSIHALNPPIPIPEKAVSALSWYVVN